MAYLDGPRSIIGPFDRLYAGFTPVAEALLRVVTGAFLVPHGAQKLFGSFDGPGIEGVTGMMTGMGFNPPEIWAWVLALSEFVGGILLAIGLLTRPAAVAAAILLFTASIMVHTPNGFFAQGGGFEHTMLWAFAALYFVFRGGNRYSIDAALGRTL